MITPKDVERQFGALGSGPVPGPSVLWQMAQATLRFPESRWEGAYAGNGWDAWYQGIGCALARAWHTEVWQEVGAVPPLKRVVPGVP